MSLRIVGASPPRNRSDEGPPGASRTSRHPPLGTDEATVFGARPGAAGNGRVEAAPRRRGRRGRPEPPGDAASAPERCGRGVPAERLRGDGGDARADARGGREARRAAIEQRGAQRRHEQCRRSLPHRLGAGRARGGAGLDLPAAVELHDQHAAVGAAASGRRRGPRAFSRRARGDDRPRRPGRGGRGRSDLGRSRRTGLPPERARAADDGRPGGDPRPRARA